MRRYGLALATVFAFAGCTSRAIGVGDAPTDSSTVVDLARPFDLAKPRDLAEPRDLAAPLWKTVAPLSAPRSNLAATTGLDGRIYAIGGIQSQMVTDLVEAYDPTTDVWQAVPPLPTPRYDPAAATGPDGRIYVFAGSDGSNNGLSSVDVYDPSMNAWQPGAPMPDALTGAFARSTSDGQIYVAGTPSKYNGSFLYPYSPATNLWSVANPIPGTCDSVFCPGFVEGVGGDVQALYVVMYGDRTLAMDAHEGAETELAFLPGTNSWTPSDPSRVSDGMGFPITTGFAITTGLDGRLFRLGGGVFSGGVYSDVAVYSPTTGGWTDVSQMPTGRMALAAATGLDGRIYAIGGYEDPDTGGLEVATVEVYTP